MSLVLRASLLWDRTRSMTDPNRPNDATRRDFLKTSTAAAVAGGVAAHLGSVPAVHAAGSDTLRIGLIGCGGRGRGAADNCIEAAENVKLVAMADAFRDPGSPIRVRIGLHVGETVHEGDDHFGHAVNYAARVAGAAYGGEALVSSLVHELVAPTLEFAFEAPRSVLLKGIDDAQLVYPLAP